MNLLIWWESQYVWRNKQSFSSYRIAPNGNRKRAGSIQQHFSFHWAAKCDGLLRKGPKSDPIQWKHSIYPDSVWKLIWGFQLTKSSHQWFSIKEAELKKFLNILRKTPVLESLFKPCNFIKKRLQRLCFLVNIVKFLRTPLKSICEHLWHLGNF